MKSLLSTILLACAIYMVQAQTNYALNLSGASQYVSIGAPIASSSSYTKEAWVYATTSSGPRNIMSSLNSPFWINGTTLSAGQAGGYSRVTDPVSFPLNRWVHVAVTYDAATTTMRLYRDGLLISTNASVPAYANENEFIGSHAGTASYFQGRIDEVRVWNVARTQAQIKANMYKGPAGNTSGLLAYYKCDNGAGTTLTNTAAGTNGTLQGGATWVASPVQYGANAMSFDGTNDFISIPDNNTLDITTAITLEAWVYATKNTGVQNVISKSSSGANNGYIFPRTDNGWTQVVAYLHIAGGWRTLSAAYPSLNAWHHLAATYDGSMIRLYINGVEAASQARTGAITANANVLALGNQTGYSEYFGGAADELRVWNVARSQADIQANMNKQLDPATQTGLVSYYSFNHGVTSGSNAGLTTLVDQAGNNNGTLNNFNLSGASSNFVAQPAIIALPLRWINFTARKQEKNVVLQWTTALEENTKDFIIQHSSSDNSEWKAIGIVPAAGNSINLQHYSFEHNNPVSGTNYYRIRQNDINGSSSYSETRSVQVNEAGKLLTVLNNGLANGMLQLKLGRPVVLALFNTEGKMLLQKQVNAGPVTLDVSKYSKGLYWLKAGEESEMVMIR